MKNNQDLPFLEIGLVLDGDKETAISSSKVRFTANFFSYLSSRFLGFFSFMLAKLQKNKISNCSQTVFIDIDNKKWLFREISKDTIIMEGKVRFRHRSV